MEDLSPSTEQQKVFRRVKLTVIHSVTFQPGVFLHVRFGGLRVEAFCYWIDRVSILKCSPIDSFNDKNTMHLTLKVTIFIFLNGNSMGVMTKDSEIPHVKGLCCCRVIVKPAFCFVFFPPKEPSGRISEQVTLFVPQSWWWRQSLTPIA